MQTVRCPDCWQEMEQNKSEKELEVHWCPLCGRYPNMVRPNLPKQPFGRLNTPRNPTT
jgi:NAD-dependent SIR2 family protein deacetylase